ncbi:tail fiber domain-containing protein [Phocaeicola vulgatus]|nr:tail fiber domain-containing protein [Phocaeicola vulgatus]MCG0160382.1 tail fiber domain-containing protein [Phocaeicola vulgatus]MCG0303045.1 tail fiber domain-containing protein [Phocaeicola vulgatus]
MMQFTRTNINKTFRNGVVNASNVAVTNVGGGSSSLSGNFLPAVNNGDGSYTVDLSKVLFTGSVISEGEVTAYGSSDGSGSTTTGGVTIIDGLDSVATDCALSANQGRILKELIDNTAGGVTALAKLTDVSLSSLTNGQILKYDAVLKKWVNDTLDNTKVTWTNIEGKPADLTDTNIAKWNELAKNNHIHTNKSALDKITEANITNWNDANNKKHTHSNKSVLDGITSAKVTNWDGVATNWNKAFYFDSNGDLKVKVNVIGEKEVSAYGAGASGGSGSITIVDALTSTATDAALSANQGRILRELIDNVGGGVSSWNDLTDKPNWITDTKPSYSWSEIGSKPSTFTPSTHTHNYASTVKVGSTSYNVSGNTISLPAYPTVPSALKNPNALTISLNGTSQGAYDGSAAKSFNITAASVGAAASLHSHSISNVSGLQDALNGKAASSHNHNSSYVSALGTNGNYLTWTKNGTTNNITVPYASNADTVDGYHQAAFSMGWTASTKYRVDRWGGSTDKNWKKIVTYVNTGGGQYQSCKVKGTIYYITGNHNQGHVIDIPFEAIMYAYGGTANSMLNQSYLYLPPYCTWDMIRIVRYNNNSWEVQVRQPSDWTNISLEYTVTNSGGSVSAGQFTNTSYSSTVANNYNTNVSRPTSSRVSSADKVNSTLSFSAGGFSTKSFNGSSNQTVNIPTHTSHLTNNSGFITSSASISGNAGSATKLQTARTINGTSFNGTANITTANWGTTRSIYIQDATATNTSSAVSVNGGGNAYLKLPTNIKVGTLTATGEVTAYSDIRLKTSIQPLENRGYIKPVTYKKDGKDSIGFIAQEVRELYPELVIEDNTEDKYLSVNYAQYVAVLQAQIIELNNRVKQLEKWHYQVQE